MKSILARLRNWKNNDISRSLESTILLATGIVLLYLSITSLINRYLLPSFRPWIGLCGVLLIAFGLWNIFSQKYQEQPEKNHVAHGSSRIALLLFIPIASLSLFLPSALDAFMLNYISRPALLSTNNTAKIKITYPPLEKNVANEIDLEELFERLNYDEQNDLSGKIIRLKGFVGPLPAGVDGSWSINRFKLSCCAADAVGYIAFVKGAPALMANTWVELEATVETGKKEEVPILRARKVTVIPTPKEPYL
ncbi:TIGR03943 family protein [Actinomycetaceae bacterium TAE3-ERU4]|nr:TIGR03943 family protein [Actinomycetaceae bacterium TAE3-ERU4]